MPAVMCEWCEGGGSVMIGPHCDLPASMCCGGCYTEVKCEKCKGTGYEKEEATEEGSGE